MLRKLIFAGLLAAIGCLFATPTASLGSQTLTVTRFDDPTPEGCAPGDCTLREAILEANANPDLTTINLPAGEYVMQVAGQGENDGATGDFDIRESVNIVGAGSGTTIIDSAHIERAFDVPVNTAVVSISGVTVKNGVTAQGGGGAGIRSIGTLTLDDVVVADNDAGGNFGGGLVVEGGTATITDSQFLRNNSFSGGGISTYTGTQVDITGSYFNSNTSGNGGGISMAGTGSIRDSVFYANQASFGGGGILSYGGNFDPDGVTMERILLDSNMATNRGGGMDISGVNRISQAAFVYNTAGAKGGAIHSGNGTLTLTNATIAGNSSDGDGGGFYSANTVSTQLTSVTIADSIGGGVFVEPSARLSIGNTIIARNGFDCTGKVTSSDYNLIGNTSGCSFTSKSHDETGVSAGLGSLTNTGDYRTKLSLSSNSPAIDTGRCPPNTDQVGTIRPEGGACDKGAVEQLDGLIWGDNDCSGSVTPADALPQLYYLAQIGPAPGAGTDICPAMGFQFPTTSVFWGDVSCVNFSVELEDVVSILKYTAGLVYQRTPSCPDIGTIYSPPEPN